MMLFKGRRARYVLKFYQFFSELEMKYVKKRENNDVQKVMDL